jgi:hypothetical protein
MEAVVDKDRRDKPHGKISKLSIEDTARTKQRLAKAKHGSDPYDGALVNKVPSRKKDLRKLGEWLEAKRKADELKRQESEAQKTRKE